MPRNPTLLASAAVLAVLAHAPIPAAAQAVFDLDEIVFSATRVPTPRSSTGSAVSVVTRDDIEAAGDVQLSSFLARLPGVSVTQSGPIGSQTSLRIRGADQRYIAVFVDGIRVDDPSLVQTGFDFGSLTTADIGRIEVLRGSQSALWGGSAVGGVINISTLGAMEDGIANAVALEAGSYGTLIGRYGFAMRSERGELAFNLSHTRTDGFSAADENDGNTGADGFEATRLSLALRHALSDTVTLGASAFWQRSRAEYDDSFPVIADADNVQRRREAGARVFAEFDLGESTQEVGLSFYRIERRFIEAFSDNSYVGERVRLDWVGRTPLGAFDLVYGGDLERESYDQSGTFGGFSSSTRIAGAFAQALFAPAEGVDLGATARIDRHSDFGTFPTFRLSGAWRATDALTLRASASTAFRAPSNFELFSAFGDPTLDPERSRSLELGADYALPGGGVIGATLFDLRARNLIDFDLTTFTYNNLPGTSRRRGVELEARLPLTDIVALDATYTWTSARSAAGDRLARVPRHDLSLGLDSRLGDRLRNVTTLQAVSDRVDTVGGASMPSFAVVNTAFTWDLTDRAGLTFRVDNVFDRQYQLVRGYGTSDRAFHVGVTSRF